MIQEHRVSNCGRDMRNFPLLHLCWVCTLALNVASKIWFRILAPQIWTKVWVYTLVPTVPTKIWVCILAPTIQWSESVSWRQMYQARCPYFGTNCTKQATTTFLACNKETFCFMWALKTKFVSCSDCCGLWDNDYCDNGWMRKEREIWEAYNLWATFCVLLLY